MTGQALSVGLLSSTLDALRSTTSVSVLYLVELDRAHRAGSALGHGTNPDYFLGAARPLPPSAG
jgi:hypothetical protein